MRDDLYSYIGGIMKNKNAKLIAAGAMFDHIHLYASLPSTISIADFVNSVKSNSSRWIHESFASLRNFAWQEGYGAFLMLANRNKAESFVTSRIRKIIIVNEPSKRS